MANTSKPKTDTTTDTTTDPAPAPDAAPDAARAAIESEGSVKTTQERLVAHGYSLAVTDSMTQETVDAVRNFQVNHGLEPTGVVGRGDDPTWQALKADPEGS